MHAPAILEAAASCILNLQSLKQVAAYMAVQLTLDDEQAKAFAPLLSTLGIRSSKQFNCTRSGAILFQGVLCRAAAFEKEKEHQASESSSISGYQKTLSTCTCSLVLLVARCLVNATKVMSSCGHSKVISIPKWAIVFRQPRIVWCAYHLEQRQALLKLRSKGNQ